MNFADEMIRLATNEDYRVFKEYLEDIEEIARAKHRMLRRHCPRHVRDNVVAWLREEGLTVTILGENLINITW